MTTASKSSFNRRTSLGMTSPTVDIRDLRFAWPGGPIVLDIEAMTLGAGERVFLKGPSGSGKSTLLNIIAGISAPDPGVVRVLGEDLGQVSGARRDRMRADHFGVVFQMFNLLPYLSALGNVLLGCRFSQRRRGRVDGHLADEGRRLLARMGLDADATADRPARALSVGQQQRVAAARALIGRPEIVLADEPTSALDADSRDRFVSLLLDEAAQSGASVLFVSHDGELASRFDRALDLEALNKAGSRDRAA